MTAPILLNRRRFLFSGAATAACMGASADEAPKADVISIGPPQRAQCDIESWNLGLIAAYRPELSSAENEARDRELLADMGYPCRLEVRGRYSRNDGSPSMELRAYLVFGSPDDSGNLKGALRKYGRKYGQDAVIHKGNYRDAELHALKDLPNLGMRDKEKKALGRFNPNLVGRYLTLLTGSVLPSHIEGLQRGLDNRWEEIEFWRPGSFFSRHERRVYFDDGGNQREIWSSVA